MAGGGGTSHPTQVISGLNTWLHSAEGGGASDASKDRLAVAGCGTASLLGVHVAGSRLAGPPLELGERYPSIVRCGKGEEARVRLMTLDHHAQPAINYLRELHGEIASDRASDRASDHPSAALTTLSAATPQPFHDELSRNVALTCLRDGTELAAIGSNSNTDPIQVRLVREIPRAQRPTPHEPFTWTHRGESRLQGGEVVANGSLSSCYEERPHMRAWVGCDFDGKFSVVSHRGALLLYARANLDDGGARHVQVARSLDDGRT